MSINDSKILTTKRPSLFKPKIRRKGTDVVFANSVDEYSSLKIFENTNIESTSSFRYNNRKGIVSTQQIDIDYSKFENHTFFHSAVAKTNEAFDSIINKYPFDGNQKQIEAYEDNLTGFEKYVLDDFPKNVGYLSFPTPSDKVHIKVDDVMGAKFGDISRNKSGGQILNPGNSPFTLEMHIKIPETTNTRQIICQKRLSTANHFTLALSASVSTSKCNLVFGVSKGSNWLYTTGSITKGKFHHIAAVYDRNNENEQKLLLYVDVDNVYTSSRSDYFGNLDLGKEANFIIGSGSMARIEDNCFIPTQTFSGSIDEFRYFKSARTVDDLKKYRYKNLDFNSESTKSGSIALCFRFNEPGGSYTGNDIALDYSGNSLHTAITNFETECRVTSSDVPLGAEKLSINPVLFPSFDKIASINLNLMTTASFYDDANPNLITKLVPPHYFEEGNELEDFETILGKFNDNFSGGRYPGTSYSKSAQLLVMFLLIWAKFFDELKIYIDTVSNLKNLSYDNYDTIPDALLLQVGKMHGLDLPSLFKGANIDQLVDGVNLSKNPGQSQLSLLTIQNTIWRRILASLPFLKTSKGTLESVKSIFRSAGIEPDNLLLIREYGGNLSNTIDGSKEEKIDILNLVNVSGSNSAISVVTDHQGRTNHVPSFKSGFLSGSRIEKGSPIMYSHVRATGTIEFTNTGAANYSGDTLLITNASNKKIALGANESSHKTIIYKFRNTAASSEATGTREYVASDGDINTVINVNLYGITANVTTFANELKTAIEHENGHGSTITVTNSSGTLTLKQLIDGDISTSGANSTIVYTNVGTSALSVSGFSGGIGMQKKNNNFFHGMSMIPSHGLYTSGSFTYEGNYYFDKNIKYPITQSLARLHVTGAADPSKYEAVATNLLYNKKASKLSLCFNDISKYYNLELENVNLITSDLWTISFGYDNLEGKSNSSGSIFLRAARQNDGRLIETFLTSSNIINGNVESGSDTSVFRNISTNYNSKGAFICIGSQSFKSSHLFLNSTGSNSFRTSTAFSGSFGNVRFFSKKVSEDEFKEHARNPTSFGVNDPLKNYLFETTKSGSFERLRLYTDVKQHTSASDSSGNFRMFDFSQNELHFDGVGFIPDTKITKPVYVKYNTLSSNYDISIADNKVRVRSLLSDDRLSEHIYSRKAPAYEVLPSEETLDDPRFSIDMSVMKGLNENIIKIFSDYDFINTALGKSNLLFGETYPDFISLRRLYFNNLTDKLNLGVYSELFKWIDNSLTDMIYDLIPHTTKFMGINFIYENHMLERNRFKYSYDEIYLKALPANRTGNIASSFLLEWVARVAKY